MPRFARHDRDSWDVASYKATATMINNRAYYVYIVTNKLRTVLYVGVTNSPEQRIVEHYLNTNSSETFTGRYKCFILVYFECFRYINQAITREKQIKKWSRTKKHSLIESINPTWNNLNHKLFGVWP